MVKDVYKNKLEEEGVKPGGVRGHLLKSSTIVAKEYAQCKEGEAEMGACTCSCRTSCAEHILQLLGSRAACCTHMAQHAQQWQ